MTPGPVLPARELLGEFLLETDEPASAWQQFRTSLTNAPNRFNSLYGVGRAAELSADRQSAAEYYGTLLRICGGATERPELKHAQKFLASARSSNAGPGNDPVP